MLHKRFFDTQKRNKLSESYSHNRRLEAPKVGNSSILFPNEEMLNRPRFYLHFEFERHIYKNCSIGQDSPAQYSSVQYLLPDKDLDRRVRPIVVRKSACHRQVLKDN